MMSRPRSWTCARFGRRVPSARGPGLQAGVVARPASAPPSAAPTASGAAPARTIDYVAPLALTRLSRWSESARADVQLSLARDRRVDAQRVHPRVQRGDLQAEAVEEAAFVSGPRLPRHSGLLMFYDLRAGKYLESNIHSSKTVTLRASRGYV
ncbi:hypothetical protein evm_015172, partial [Chilo suppressalis]